MNRRSFLFSGQRILSSRLVLLLLLSVLLSSCNSDPIHQTVLSAEPPIGAVSGRYLAATVIWSDPRSTLLESSLESADGVELLSLDEVRLPRKIISIDKLLPGDEGYPLIEWTVATHPRTGEALPQALESDQPILNSPPIYRIAAVGDIMPGRGFNTLLTGEGGEAEAIGDVAPLLSEPDLLIGNLETAVTDHDMAVPKSYNFKVSEATLRALTGLGFDYYHLANNHSWDYGEIGFLDTLAALDSVGVGYSGAGAGIESARYAWETDIPVTEGLKLPQSRKIRILSLGAYFTERNGFDGASIAAAGPDKSGVLWDSPENEDSIRETLAQTDAFTIVTVHGGYEWHSEPGEEVMALYRRYVTWGADLVVAHHPHVLQGMEIYEGAPIAYSLGNFIFPGMKGWYTGEETGVLDFLILDGRIIGINFHPVAIDDSRIRRADSSGIDDRFWAMSRDMAAAPRD